jgi:hypothetical protein
LAGAASSKRVTEEHDGALSAVSNRAASVRVEVRLTAREIARADTKVGPSDPADSEWKGRRSSDKRYSRRSQGFGCSPIKAARELGLDRRETGRSLSGVGVG